MEWVLILKLAIGSALFIILMCFAFFLIECIRIVGQVRKIAERIQLLTDVKGWFEFFSFLKGKKKRNK